MFFWISKIVFFVIQPSTALVLLLALGFVLLWTRRRTLGRWLIGAAAAGLLVFGLSPVANLAIIPLEERFPQSAPPEAVDGIIILGGAVDTIVTSTRGQTALTTSGERITVAARLAARHPGARIVHTGGEGLLLASGTSEAEGALPLLLSFGIAEDRLVMEDKSRNTWENAVLTRELLGPQPGQTWLLVTSAYHMPRAMGVFRAAGWDGVTAYPVDFRTRGWQDQSRWFPGVSQGLRRFDIAVREWIGLLAYWATGRSSALFPAPDKPERRLGK